MIELMRALDTVFDEDWRTFAGMNRNLLLTAERAAPWFGRRVTGHADGGRSPGGVVRNEAALRRLVRSAPRRVVHRTYHPMLDLLPASTTVVETVHDLWDFVAADERGARAALRRRLKRRALARADRIVCVSQSTRDMLGDMFPRLADRATVIPHGVRRLSDTPVRVDHGRPFHLFVGQRGRYKNWPIALEALALVPDAGLVCFGGGAFSARELKAIAGLGLGGRVVQVDGDDHRLAGHYEAACALLYPSKHEGFGLPLLEAMAHGCPVIASPLTSLPEVGGDAAAYADADDAEAWANAMRRIVEDGDLRQRTIAAGLRRAGEFSWRAAAQRHATLYRQLG